jgi:hypothetical protein
MCLRTPRSIEAAGAAVTNDQTNRNVVRRTGMAIIGGLLWAAYREL